MLHSDVRPNSNFDSHTENGDTFEMFTYVLNLGQTNINIHSVRLCMTCSIHILISGQLHTVDHG